MSSDYTHEMTIPLVGGGRLEYHGKMEAGKVRWWADEFDPNGVHIGCIIDGQWIMPERAWHCRCRCCQVEEDNHG